MSERELVLRLALIDGVGPRTVQALRASFGSLTALIGLSARDLEAAGVRSALARSIAHALADRVFVERVLGAACQAGAELVVRGDVGYPARLAAVDEAPLVLWVKGVPLVKLSAGRMVAVVGSRDADSYGLRMTEQIVRDLVAAKTVVVSGGARGVDSGAHRATLAHGGVTVAVLGSGLLKPYPAEHKKLFEDIVATGGAVVSPFDLLMAPLAGNFPARNRIISGLSDGVIVVQAAARSGALSTARGALDQGREVGAVPGPADHPLHAGCHALIRDGAVLVTQAADMLAALPAPPLGSSSDPSLTEPSLVEPSAAGFSGAAIREGKQGHIIALCRTPQPFDGLLATAGVDARELQQLLFELMVAGAIAQNSGGFWVSCF